MFDRHISLAVWGCVFGFSLGYSEWLFYFFFVLVYFWGNVVVEQLSQTGWITF
jgi:hypothetical protein